MMLRKGLATAAVTLLLSSAAWAQTSTSGGIATPTSSGTTGGTTTSTAGGTSGTTGTFAALSPGNQTIAQALFEAQQPPLTTTSTGTTITTSETPLTLDQIAGLKGHEGWGVVFKQMKAEGLVQAKNLGQVVSSYQHEVRVPVGTTTSRNTVVTGASGRTLASNGNAHSGTTAGSGASHGQSSGSGDEEEASSATVTSPSAGGPASFSAMGITHGGGTTTSGFGGGATSHGGASSAHGR